MTLIPDDGAVTTNPGEVTVIVVVVGLEELDDEVGVVVAGVELEGVVTTELGAGVGVLATVAGLEDVVWVGVVAVETEEVVVEATEVVVVIIPPLGTMEKSGLSA